MAGSLARGIHGIPVVADTTERDLVYPTPERDQRVELRDTGEIQRYTGTEWAHQSGQFYASQRAQGIHWVTDPTYGATGDGTTDDTTAAETALASAPSGGRVVFPRASGYYRITRLLTVPAGVTVEIPVGVEVRQVTAGTGAFTFSGSRVGLGGGGLVTVQAGSGQDRAHSAIRGLGTVDSYATGIDLDVRTSGGNYGILLQFCRDVRISPRVHADSVYYGGIFGESTDDVVMVRPKVTTVTGTPNAYGIAATRAAGTSLAVNPTSKRWDIIAPRVDGVLNWTGIDTHAGEDIRIYWPDVDNAYIGIGLGTDSDDNAPVRCKVHGGTVRQGSAASNRGIILSGTATSAATDCEIVGTQIDGHGSGGSASGGAVYVVHTTDCRVADVRSENATASGITVGGVNTRLTVSEPRVDTVTAAGADSAAIKCVAGATWSGVLDAWRIATSSAVGGIRIYDDQPGLELGHGTYAGSGTPIINPTKHRKRAPMRGVYENASQSTALTGDVSQYELYVVTLTGSIGIGAPTGIPQVGQRIAFIFTQDATGGRTVSWNPVFKTDWTNTGNAAGAISRVAFEYNGTYWVQISRTAYL